MHTKAIIAYFALLAIAVGGLSGLGIKPSMPVLLASMGLAALVLFLGKLIVTSIKRKMDRHGLTGKQWMAVMVGAPPNMSRVVDAVPVEKSSQAVMVRPQYPLVPYAQGDAEGDLPEAIIEANGLPLSETFQPSIHDFLGQMVSVFGIRRMGKSNCVTLIIEALAPYLVPMLICDTKDEYAGLVNQKYLPHGYMAGAPGATANVPDEIRRLYIPLDEDGAFGFGKAIMEGHMQVVLNLKSYETDDEGARVMCGVIRGINAWQEERPNKDRIPVEIVLDEGHKWLPQNESSEVSKETQALLHKTFFSTIVRLGGFNGFGFIVASQRISELDKRCLQSTCKFLLKQTETIDIKKYEEWNLEREDILSLQPGECFVFSPRVLGFRVKLSRKKSPDFSMTPGLEQLDRHRQVAHAKHEMLAYRKSYTRNPVNEVGLPEPVKTETITEEVPVAKVSTKTHPVYDSAPQFPRGLSPKQQLALKLYHEGKKRHRDLSAAMSMNGTFGTISESEAYRLLVQLDNAGYIQREKRIVS